MRRRPPRSTRTDTLVPYTTPFRSVDDAIGVIENVERVMEEDKSTPYEATIKAVRQIYSAIIGITLVLVSVFIPMAFFPGSTGAIYRQFAVTLALSISFSGLLEIGRAHV